MKVKNVGSETKTFRTGKKKAAPVEEPPAYICVDPASCLPWPGFRL